MPPERQAQHVNFRMEPCHGGRAPIPDRVVEAVGFNPPPLRAAWQRPPGSGKPLLSSGVPQADPLQSLLVTRNPGNPRGSFFSPDGKVNDNKQSVNEAKRPQFHATKNRIWTLRKQGDSHENAHTEFGTQHTVLVSRCFCRKQPENHNDQQGYTRKRHGCLQEQLHPPSAASLKRVLLLALR